MHSSSMLTIVHDAILLYYRKMNPYNCYTAFCLHTTKDVYLLFQHNEVSLPPQRRTELILKLLLVTAIKWTRCVQLLHTAPTDAEQSLRGKREPVCSPLPPERMEMECTQTPSCIASCVLQTASFVSRATCGQASVANLVFLLSLNVDKSL